MELVTVGKAEAAQMRYEGALTIMYRHNQRSSGTLTSTQRCRSKGWDQIVRKRLVGKVYNSLYVKYVSEQLAGAQECT